tara:strand:- start:167 stop:418 length:252 start_codon:yes stop_codon:yes gene_type:complete
MQRIKHTFYISVIILGFMISPVNPLSPVINIGPAQIDAATNTIPTKHQTAITEIKNKQTETGSIISEHTNIKRMDTLSKTEHL